MTVGLGSGRGASAKNSCIAQPRKLIPSSPDSLSGTGPYFRDPETKIVASRWLGPSLLLSPVGPQSPKAALLYGATAPRDRARPQLEAASGHRETAACGSRHLRNAALRPVPAARSAEGGAAPLGRPVGSRRSFLRVTAFLPPREGKESRSLVCTSRPRSGAPPRKKARAAATPRWRFY